MQKWNEKYLTTAANMAQAEETGAGHRPLLDQETNHLAASEELEAALGKDQSAGPFCQLVGENCQILTTLFLSFSQHSLTADH